MDLTGSVDAVIPRFYLMQPLNLAKASYSYPFVSRCVFAKIRIFLVLYFLIFNWDLIDIISLLFKVLQLTGGQLLFCIIFAKPSNKNCCSN